jgi:flagellar hook-associated protein 1
MSNSAGLLSIARTALSLHQRAIDVVGQNVANAGVEGYSRQRIEASAAHPIYFANVGHLGTGVRIDGIERARDEILDRNFRMQHGGRSGAEFSLDVLTQLEGIIGEPSETGLVASLDAFWSSWSDLASNPTNPGARGIVQQRGAQVASTLNRFASQLDEIHQVTRERIGTMVGEANEISREIAQLNTMIVAGESGGYTANDLRDARDQAIDRLSSLGSVESITRDNGSVAVYLGGMMVVDASESKDLALESIGGGMQIVFAAQPGKPLSGLGGQLGAALDTVNRQLPATMRELDALAATIVDTVNGIHATGVVWSGSPPVSAAAPDFFRTDAAALTPADDRFRTARYITLSDDVATSAANVAASAAAASGPGNNAIALQLAGLRDTAVAVTDTDGTARGSYTIGAYWRQIATGVGLSVRTAETEVQVRTTLAENAETRRQSVSGVSTDEELVLLIKHQQAYAAAARLVTVAEEMSRILVELGR